MANEKKLHLVEIRKENNYFPTVLASPATARDSSEISTKENLDFKQYVMDGRIPLERKTRLPFYTTLPSWLTHLRRQERRRDQDRVIMRLRAEYGEIRSFHADKYPEATAYRRPKKNEDNEESSEV